MTGLEKEQKGVLESTLKKITEFRNISLEMHNITFNNSIIMVKSISCFTI